MGQWCHLEKQAPFRYDGYWEKKAKEYVKCTKSS